ncbi:MAG TPA: potassium transporter TrkG [Bacteroidales bacterium]|nr:potassium transporter TrkG [Bacteroidales bacterium]HLN52631.1 potassium transporter TrkG [Lentimicrobium sp.]
MSERIENNLLTKPYQIILKQVGSLVSITGYIIAIPVVVGAIYGEGYSMAGFLLAAVIVWGTGSAIYRIFKCADDPHSNHSLVIAASGWLAVTLAGALPFLIIAWMTPEQAMNSFIPPGAGYNVSSLVYFRNPLHCFFESMSAYTTTGLSMAVHEPSVGKAILFYRSLANWFGGAGFIIMVLAVFRQASGKGANLLFSAESTSKKLKPRIIETTRAIWKVYAIVTLFSFLYLVVGTLIILPHYGLSETIFDSFCHAMSGQSTGGFSTLDDSIATYHSYSMEMLYLLPMIIGSFSMPFLFKVVMEGNLREIWHDIQTRALLILFVVGSLVQTALLMYGSILPDPFRIGVFQFISGLSTTGWQTTSFAQWDWLSVVFISCVAMYIGGASGGTVGGIKMIRALFLLKGLKWSVGRTFQSESTIKTVKFNYHNLHETEIYEEFSKAAVIAILAALLILFSAFITYILTGTNFTFKDALVESASSQGTVGLSSGITDPSMNPLLEVIYIFQMWTGRLEIIPILALIRAIFRGTAPRKL